MPRILTAAEIDPALLDAFLNRSYSPAKSAFLREHGAWWHGSDQNRLILLVGDEIAGYCAVIPVRVWVAGQAHKALWWVDLVIAPEFRGRGLQSLFDQQIRDMADLLLGFPNLLAAKIHRKHGWGVREDMQTLLLPLVPALIRPVLGAHGLRRLALRVAAWLFTPLAFIWRFWLASQKPQNVFKLPALDANLLAGIFQRTYKNKFNTTLRDSVYLAWRYSNVPHPEEYSFLLAGPPDAPTHYLVARHIAEPGRPAHTRILDVFGDFSDASALFALLTLAAQDAIVRGSSQVIVLASIPQLRWVACRLGFVFSAPSRFCWLGESAECMSALAGVNYWTLADSDNDSPE